MNKIMLGIFVLLFMATAGHGQEPKQTLELTIKSDKEIYKVGEGINIEASMKNTGKDSVKIYSPEYWGVSEIVVVNSKGMTMKPRGLKVKRNGFDSFLIIPPNESRTSIFNNLMWFFCGGAWQFSDEAQLTSDIYKIYVKLTNPPANNCDDNGKIYEKTALSGTITSNTITIEVKSLKTH